MRNLAHRAGRLALVPVLAGAAVFGPAAPAIISEGRSGMRRLGVVLAVAAVSFTAAAGVATAAPAVKYEVTDSWKLTYIDGSPTVLPEMIDDTVEVKCWRNDKMTGWKVNNKKLVGGSTPRTDGTGIFVQPEFTGKTTTLTITVSCTR
jgi:hypothetical protein